MTYPLAGGDLDHRRLAGSPVHDFLHRCRIGEHRDPGASEIVTGPDWRTTASVIVATWSFASHPGRRAEALRATFTPARPACADDGLTDLWIVPKGVVGLFDPNTDLSLSLAGDADLDAVSDPLTIDPMLVARLVGATQDTIGVPGAAELLGRLVADAGVHGADPLEWLAATEAVLGGTPTLETYDGIVGAVAAVFR